MKTDDAQQTKPARRPLLVALTGGVASGKTAVSDRLARRGAPVVDTDVIARAVVEPGSEGLEAVVEAFGEEVLDSGGGLDRRMLRERVFSDDRERERLERILHPRIEREARRQIAEHADASYVVLVVPLLVESGLFHDAERIVVVDAPDEARIRRLRERDGVDRRRAEAMLAAQAGREERLARATDVIDNSGSPEQLLAQVDRLHEKLTSL